jgi:hypothetical protein
MALSHFQPYLLAIKVAYPSLFKQNSVELVESVVMFFAKQKQ